MKPWGCHRTHIPNALEHPTGLPNPQPIHEVPTPGPLSIGTHHTLAKWLSEKERIFLKERGGRS